jgi:hypothetical protein
MRLIREVETTPLHNALHFRLRDAVIRVQMLGVGFLAVKDTFAGGVFGKVVGCAEPAGEVEVLGGFVAFPVCFAAEGFGAVGKCTAVRTFVTFLVFSVWGEGWLDGLPEKSEGVMDAVEGDLLHFAT